jgi:hypothetical protein
MTEGPLEKGRAQKASCRRTLVGSALSCWNELSSEGERDGAVEEAGQVAVEGASVGAVLARAAVQQASRADDDVDDERRLRLTRTSFQDSESSTLTPARREAR